MTDDGALSLLGRRLERLRREDVPATAPDGKSSSRPGPSSPRLERAAALAAGVGGAVTSTPDGPVVVVESAAELRIEVGALARLPYDVDAGRPLVCIDLETTGLGTAAGTLPFLVGVATWDDHAMRISQYLLPDHSHEPALLTALTGRIPAGAWLVTYNGRSFDWPLLVSRYRLHRRQPPQPAGHLDLLPVARQLWKHRLGNARLATIERLAGVNRPDDLPGALVPERYFRYLHDGGPLGLRAVVSHNRQDLLSLGLLIGVLTQQLGRRERWPAVHPGDLGGLARAYARRGRVDEALDCLEAGLRSGHDRGLGLDGGAVRRRLLTERARLLARSARHAEAAAAWLELASGGGPGAAAAWLWLARHREHRLRDPASALHACQQAVAIAERARAWGRPLYGIERDLRRRVPRLRRRLMSTEVGPVVRRLPAA